jgi:hypothetical protein
LDFEEIMRRRRAMEDNAMAQEDGRGRGWQPAKMLFCGWSLVAYTGFEYKTTHV